VKLSSARVKAWHAGQLGLVWVAAVVAIGVSAGVFFWAPTYRVGYDPSRPFPHGPMYMEDVWWGLPLKIICALTIGFVLIGLFSVSWIWLSTRR
jgi:heme/copper-type cytochrome/quinol oxidase subunit 2